jgi:hypothetical protein
VTVDGSEREWYWCAWTSHCRLYLLNCQGPSLPPCNIEDMLLTFVVAVWEGQCGIGRQVKVQSVTTALWAIAQRYVLDGHSDPRHASPAQHALNLPIAQLIKKFKDNNPPLQPKLAIPVTTIWQIATKYKFSAHHKAVADLVAVAFFYLLWVGEYTTSSREHEKRMVPLRKCDLQLWKDGNLLDHEYELKALLMADSATISIANTKNGMKGAVVHHGAIGGVVCPVAALARQIANLRGMEPACGLSMVCHPAAHTTQVLDRCITVAVRWRATFDCLLDKGYTLDRVSSHRPPLGGGWAQALRSPPRPSIADRMRTCTAPPPAAAVPPPPPSLPPPWRGRRRRPAPRPRPLVRRRQSSPVPPLRRGMGTTMAGWEACVQCSPAVWPGCGNSAPRRSTGTWR